MYVFFLGAPLIARIPGVIFHASSASITAYGIAKKNPLPYYLISVSLHLQTILFALEAALPFGVLAEFLVLIVAYFLAWHFYHQSSQEKIVV